MMEYIEVKEKKSDRNSTTAKMFLSLQIWNN